jgi:hypothetical protein
MEQLITALFPNYHLFGNQSITNRFFKHRDLVKILAQMHDNPLFQIREVGKSVLGRSINLVTVGNGPIKVFLWSQMHGNEATATMALMDLFTYLGDEHAGAVRDSIMRNCTLYILPMVNPDGAEIFNRRNAQEIDINRDFNHQQSPEGRMLRTLRDEIEPQFGFNLHDQQTMWSAGDSGKPATISLLAPAYDQVLSVNPVRLAAMQVIAKMNEQLQELIPEHVGRFDDEYEPRAFGDNFQAAGTSTILIEAGGYANDPEKQYIRKLVFVSILSGLLSISERTFSDKKEEDYFAIPENKLRHFQILLRNCIVQVKSPKPFDNQQAASEGEARIATEAVLDSAFRMDIGLIAKETVNEDLHSMRYEYVVGDLGDLSTRFAYKDLDCSSFTLIQTQKLQPDELADIVLMDGTEVLLAIEKGILTNCTV